jgi:undecaprenyl-diphosphatase
MFSDKSMTTLRSKVIHLEKKNSADLSSSNLLAKRPVVGVIMFVVGILVFGSLYYNFRMEGPLLKWDKQLASTLPSLAQAGPSYLKYVMNAGFYLGTTAITAIAIYLGIYYIHKRFWQEFWMLVLGWGGGGLWFLFLSRIIDRPRPADQIFLPISIPGFPSGHAITVVVAFGFLAYIFVPKIKSHFWKWVVIVTAALAIIFVGFSRVFTGGHYLTDILAGYAFGLAWAGLVYTGIELFFSKRRASHPHRK